jgi:hypothetical protein
VTGDASGPTEIESRRFSGCGMSTFPGRIKKVRHRATYVYKADGGVSWRYVGGCYGGLEVLAPSIPKSFVVIFTVPIDPVNKPWTLIFPDGQSAPLAPPYKAEPKRMAYSAYNHNQMPAIPFNFNGAGKGR